MRRARDDRGFSVVETVVSAGLAMAVAAGLVTVLSSGQRRERDLTEIAASQEDLRRGLVELLQDVRAAEPLGFTATTPATGAELRVQRWEDGASEPTLIRWHVETVDGGATLVRDVVELDAGGTIASAVPTYRLAGVSAETTSVEFFDDDGDPIPATEQARISDCAAKVRVTLRAAAMNDRHPASVVSEAELRNHAEDMPWCA